VSSSRAFYGKATGTTAGTVAAGNDNRFAADAPVDHGFLGWTFPTVNAVGSTAIPTAGVLYLQRIRRVATGTVTNIVIYVGTAGNTLTAGQCGAALYTAAGVRLGQTADQATAWASTGLKTMAISGGPVAVTAGDLYVGLWFNGTTGPALTRGGTFAGAMSNAGQTAPNFSHASADSGVTTTAPNPFGVQSSSANQWWVAIS